MKNVRILGIDPGYAIVGFGVLDYDGIRFTPIEYGAVLTEAGTPFPERLRAIHEDIEFIFNKFKPDCMAIERLYFTTNQKTAIDVAQARGITVLSAATRNIPVSEYTPLQVTETLMFLSARAPVFPPRIKTRLPPAYLFLPMNSKLSKSSFM